MAGALSILSPTGPLVITSDLFTSFFDAICTILNTHTHPNVTSGNQNTGPPNAIPPILPII